MGEAGGEPVDGETGRPVHLRYVGSIFVLHSLMEMLDACGLTAELAPGPTPDVSVVVHTHLVADGVRLLHDALAQWRARFGHEAMAVPI